jgi:hypothetical protein
MLGNRARRLSAGAWLVFAVVAAGCLSPDAEPIVRSDANDAGSAGDGSPKAPDSASACPTGAPLALYYRAAQAAAQANAIDFLFKIQNATGAAVPLSSLAVRYYFTNELATWQTSVYYADECCGDSRSGFTSDVTLTVNALANPTPTADHYIEVTFDAAAGDLLNGDAVQIEVGVFAPGHAQNLDQANDYSFVATATGTQTEWDMCPPQCAQFQSCVTTVYENGALVWGVPP